MRPYPNPCDACTKSGCPFGGYCHEFKVWFLYHWKQIHSYPIRAYRKHKRKKTDKFCYEHPDIVRRYLEKGPCEKCPMAEDCETVCIAYWHWWDARMEWMKGWWGK